MFYIMNNVHIFVSKSDIMVRNKELQEERVRNYFIQAANELLKSEGLKTVTVRSVAERAGYSYGTLYNYFKDLNELLFCCMQTIVEELQRHVSTHSDTSVQGMARIRSLATGYMDYFCEYPGIFEVFYLAKVGEFGNKESTIRVLVGALDALCAEEWSNCIKDNRLTAEVVEQKKTLLRNVTVGLLLHYLNRRSPDSYEAFRREAEECLKTAIPD